MKTGKLPFLVGIAACILGTNQAQAQADLTFRIDDLTEGRASATVIGSDFVPGTLLQSSLSGFPESIDFSFLVYNPTWSAGGGMAIFAEPEDPAGPLSDALFLKWSGPIDDLFYGLVSAVDGRFYSDSVDNIIDLPRADQFPDAHPYVETGQPVLVPLLDADPATGGPNYGLGGAVPFIVYVTSDIDVPEPSTTMIAGALLLVPFGAQAIRRLRNRKPVA